MAKKGEIKNRKGENFITNEGYTVKIVEYFSYKNCTIQFEDDIVVKGVCYSALTKGMVKKPFKLGEKHLTYQGYEVEVIEYFNSKNCTVRFNDVRGTVREELTLVNIRRGEVKNLYHPSICDIGYMGQGKYKPNENKKSFTKWNSMLRRCYGKVGEEINPSYKDVTVCEEWHNFQNFAKWYEDNWKPWMDSSWQLDKDILCGGDKVYSPNTCCFIPREINNLLVKPLTNKGNYLLGVSRPNKKFLAVLSINNKRKVVGSFDTEKEASEAFKKAKKEYIVSVAEKWKKLIDIKIYIKLTST